MIFYKNGYSHPISYASYYPRPPKSTFIPPLYSPNDPQELAVIQLLKKYGKQPIDYGNDQRNGLEIGIVYGNNAIIKRYTSPSTPQYAIVYLAAYFSPEEVFDKFDQFMIELQNRLKNKEFAIDCEQFAVIKKLLKRNGYVMSGEGLESQITFGQSKRNTIKKSSKLSGYGLISYYLTKYFPLNFLKGQSGSIEQTYETFDHLVLQLNNIILKEAEKK